MKKGVSKKNKKQVTEEIAKLESDLKARQEKEILEFDDKNPIEQVSESLGEVVVNEEGPRVSKAQKRREKKEQEARQREEDIKAAEEASKYGPRSMEKMSILSRLKARKLQLHEVPANGDCMFASILHQFPENLSISDLRQRTADEIRSSEGDYRPFLTHPESGDMLSDEQFEEYCCKMATEQSSWGSQVELKAISKMLNVRIEVVQGEGPLVVIGESADGGPLVLTYHRHQFGLGEHYNSVNPIE